MEKTEFLEAIKEAKEKSKDRNFRQSLDLIVNLKNIDLDQPDNKLDFYVELPDGRGQEIKTCAIVGKGMAEEAEKVCDYIINVDTDLEDYKKNPRKFKKIASEADFFLASAKQMNVVGKVFGRYLGPRDKMPETDLGCIIRPGQDIKPVVEKLENMVPVRAKDQPVAHVLIGSQDMENEELAENALEVYDRIERFLPKSSNQIGKVYVKLTMGPSIEVK